MQRCLYCIGFLTDENNTFVKRMPNYMEKNTQHDPLDLEIFQHRYSKIIAPDMLSNATEFSKFTYSNVEIEKMVVMFEMI